MKLRFFYLPNGYANRQRMMCAKICSHGDVGQKANFASLLDIDYQCKIYSFLKMT